MDEEEKALTAALQELLKLPDSEKASKLTGLVQKYEALVQDKPLEVATVPGKLSPPKVLIGGDAGWNPASDAEGTLKRLFPGDPDQHKIGERAAMLESLLIRFAPEEAFKRMVPRLGSTKPTLKDAMHLLAACDRQSGTLLSKQIPKELWLQFYNSPNPCYKILALEKYDSTTQSPEELLKLYRECLFHTFGYLQVRALEGIHRSKDNRPEVVALLREYLKSSPTENDGTLPTYPEGFGNPIRAAEYLMLRYVWLRNPDGMSATDRTQWEHDIRQSKYLPAQLVPEILSARISRDAETLRLTTRLLAYRHDVDPEDLEYLVQPVQQMLEEDTGADLKNEIDNIYAVGLLLTLRNHPSLEHEKLAIALTESKNGAVHANAALTLAKIGSKNSVIPMEKLATRTRPPEGASNPHHDEVLQALKELKERLAKTPSPE